MWSILLSLLMKSKGNKNFLLYPVAKGFLTRFGSTLLWWAVLALTLASVVVLELGVSSVRKAFWPTDTDLFQELQKDPVIRRRFEDTARGEGDVEMGREKSSLEEEREGEIQELLDRPRVMDREEGLVKSPVEAEFGSRTSLTRRKISVDGGKQSVDVGEGLGRR